MLSRGDDPLMTLGPRKAQRAGRVPWSSAAKSKTSRPDPLETMREELLKARPKEYGAGSRALPKNVARGDRADHARSDK